MNEVLSSEEAGTASAGLRGTMVALLVLSVTVAHWWMPQGQDSFHAVHIALRKSSTPITKSSTERAIPGVFLYG